MGYRPPKGVRPAQLEGKRTGRPKGSKSYARFWQDAVWAYQHRYEGRASPPTPGARLWWWFAYHFPDELTEFLEEYGRI